MTSQKDQLQALIADIDKVLQKASPRLPWVISGDVAQQRRVLERVRSYLVSLQQKQASDGTLGAPRIRSNLSTYDIQYQPSQAINLAEGQVPPSQQAAAQQILQAVMQEMEQLRTGLTQPLQADLAALQQQRESLVQEIRKLESQRQQYSLAQQQANQQQIISEFLKVLMGRLQENLTQQISQTLTTALSESLVEEGRSAPSASLSGNFAGTPLLHPAQRLEELQMLQARSDQLLMTLDSTLSVLFEALHRNVHSYEESLSRGLERMHDLGQQGEVMFTALVSHLAQQLGREASSYLQSSLQTPSLEATNASSSNQVRSEGQSREEAAVAGSPVATTPTTPENNSTAELTLPYPGAELRQQPDDWTSLTTDTDSLENLNLDIDPLSLEDINLDNVEALLGEDVSELDNSLAETNSPELLSSLSEFSELGVNRTEQDSGVTVSEPTSVTHAADLAEELDFLQQLNQVLQDQPSDASSTAPQSHPAPQAEVDSATASDLPETAADVMGAPDELDEFYTSLFGQDAIAPSGSETPATPGLEQPIVSDLENISAEAADASAMAEIEPEEITDSTPPLDITAPPIADLAAVVEVGSQPPSSPVINQTSETVANSGTDLFGSFTDLGDDDAAIASEPTPEANSAEAASPIFDLEDFSTDFATTPADVPNPPDPLAELVDLLGDGSDPEASVANPAPVVSDEDQFAGFSEEENFEESLSDLIPTVPPAASSVPATNWLEDNYTLAAPDESLLETDDLGEANDVTLWIDDQLVQQLNQDLSNLESNDSEFSLDLGSSAVPASPTDSTTLDDLFPLEDEGENEVTTPETPIVTGADPSSDFTLEALDDFFGDLEPTEAPPALETAPPAETTTESPAAQYPTEVDTQSITLDDVFGDLLADEKKKSQ